MAPKRYSSDKGCYNNREQLWIFDAKTFLRHSHVSAPVFCNIIPFASFSSSLFHASKELINLHHYRSAGWVSEAQLPSWQIVKNDIIFIVHWRGLWTWRNISTNINHKSSLIVPTLLYKYIFFLYFSHKSPPLGHGPLIHEFSWSHTTTHHSR
jgi:hypothetical protein